MKYFLYAFMLLLPSGMHAQNVGVGTNTPNPSAQLDVSSTRGGLLPPRMNYAQIRAISNPAAGLMVWCTNCGTSGNLLLYNGVGWTASSTSTQPLTAFHTCAADSVHNPALTYGTMTDQDGNVYKTIQIGTQTWMAENLKARRYRNGNVIPVVENSTTWSSLTTGATCWYNNDSTAYNCPYGKLYNWYAVADSRNLCPTGWHVPSDAEFYTLTNLLGTQGVAGGKMKSAGTRYWLSPNTAADNSSGWSGIPGGIRYGYGGFRDVGSYCYWWSSEGHINDIDARGYGLDYRYSNAFRFVFDKNSGYTVRCLKD